MDLETIALALLAIGLFCAFALIYVEKTALIDLCVKYCRQLAGDTGFGNSDGLSCTCMVPNDSVDSIKYQYPFNFSNVLPVAG